MPEACFQHDERELRLPSRLVPISQAGKVRSGCPGLMDRNANKCTVDVRALGFVPVEVASR